MEEYLRAHSLDTDEGLKDALDYAWALSTKYGEGAAALSCEMYDAMARLSNVEVPLAEPAAVAEYGEVAKTVQGIMKWSTLPQSIGAGVGRLVKQAGADTTLQNALRDGAQFAWIPHGDTCAFCMMLASNGWQRASKKALKNGHAEHIHNNCDCTYAVRFDDKTTVAGYDPDRLYEEYKAHDGDLNAWRRDLEATRRPLLNLDLQFFAKKHKTRKVPQSDPLWDSLVMGDVEKQLKDGIFTWKHGEYEYLIEITERYEYNYLSKKKLKNIHDRSAK